LKKLVGFITSSLPDNEFSIDLAYAMKDAGVDTIELGIPFSDPVADGPVIEKASLQVLNNGFKMDDLFYVSEKIGKDIDTLWMGYMNPFYAKGMEFFLQKAKETGISGMIIPDLPYEETLTYTPLFDKYDKSLISFVAPTDPKERIELITKDAKKFIYLVAYAGITGSGQSEDLTQIIADIKASTDTPVYTGFGVNEKTAKEKAKGVDGVIVGSAFVNILLDNSLSNNEKIKRVSSIASNIKDLINQ